MRIISESPTPRASLSTTSEIAPPFPAILFNWGIILYWVFSAAILVIPEISRDYLTAHNPATGEPIIFLRSHVFKAYFFLLWAFAGFYSIPLPWRILMVSSVPLIIYLPRVGRYLKQRIADRGVQEKKFLFTAIWAGIVGSIIFYLCRVSVLVNNSFGDAPKIPLLIEQGSVLPAERLTDDIYHLFRLLMFWISGFRFDARTAVIVVNCLAGGFFVTAIFLLARMFGKSIFQRVGFALALILSGYTVTFFGYVETTQVALAAMAGFFCCAITAMHCELVHHRKRWEVGAIIFASITLLAHAAGILLLPALAILLMKDFNGRIHSIITGLKSLFSRRTITMVFSLIVIPYFLLIAQPFFLHNDFGDVGGGGDNVMFVPFQFDYSQPASQYIHYSMFSMWHFYDILSSFIIAAPVAILLIIGSWFLIKRWNISFSIPDRQVLWLTGTAASFSVLVPLLWNHDFGMWGDWNIAVTYLFPLNLFVWLLFLTVLKQFSFHTVRTYRFVLTLTGIQAILCFGILMQLY
jgi:hypothetical protein